jgi:chaperonin cofactor prefoldin
MDEELKKLIESTAAETRRHFDVAAERLETKIETVAEGILGVDERVERFETAMHEEFNDVRSMIKFSHHELDRRLRTLEEVVSDLQARVERLESSTH